MTSGGNPFRTKAELDAFFCVRSKVKDRLPATVWIFENQDGNFVVFGKDGGLPAECLPSANVWKYSLTVPENHRDDDDDRDGSAATGEVAKVALSSVHKKDTKKFLQHLLMVKHFRVDIFQFDPKTKIFEKAVSGSPCDLGDIRQMMYGEDSGAEYGQMLGMGPTCCIFLAGDVKESKVGVAFWHEATKKAVVAEFYDNPSMDILESLVVQHSPMECVLPSPASPKYRQIKTVLERNSVLVNPMSSKKSELDKCDGDVLRVIPIEDKQFFEANGLAVRALSGLALHSNMSVEALTSENQIRVLDTQEFILFNSQADAGLNIFDTTESAQGISLFKVLNRTRTAGGERMLRVWLKQPLTNKDKICERLDIVEQLVNSSGVRKSLHENVLRRMPDFESVALKIRDKRAQLSDLYKCYMGVKEAGKACALISQDQSDLMNQNFVAPLEKKCQGLAKFCDLIDSTLDFDALNEGKFMVNPNFDNELQELKVKLDEVKEGIDASLGRLANAVGLDKKNVKLETTSQHGYCFRVTMKDEKVLRKKSGIFVVDTNKTGVRFRNSQLESLNKEFLELSANYDQQQQYVVSEILTIAEGYVAFVSGLGHLVSRLDCLVSFAVASEQAPIPYVKPEVTSRTDGDQELLLEEARHPCLETMDNMCFIPNDARFDKKSRGFCIITGPNLGGKSTYLRSVALNVLMAQVGCFVACKSAKLFPVDRILVRIGAGDSQLTGVSTFMAEMLEASYIVRSSTEHSLILIDELGRGTSTYDGLGLAWAISKHIASEIGAFALFATHFHEITKLSQELPNRVFNCYVDAIATDSQFTLLYNVKAGSSAKSFGIEVAKLAGFPDEVVEDAKTFLQQAEMPLLRSKEAFSADATEIADFLEQWKDESVDKKRKAQLLADMRAKVAKVAPPSAASE